MQTRLRRLPWLILFLAIAATAVDPRLFRRLRPDPGTLRGFYQRGSPARRFEQFLNHVARDTEPGASVLIAVPALDFARDYAYPFYRSTYLLSGRRVIPLMDADQKVHLERLEQADYVAAWRVRPRGFEPVWTEGEGSLYRRRR